MVEEIRSPINDGVEVDTDDIAFDRRPHRVQRNVPFRIPNCQCGEYRVPSEYGFPWVAGALGIGCSFRLGEQEFEKRRAGRHDIFRS